MGRSPCQVFASPGRALLFLRCLTLQLVVEFCRGKGVIQVARVYRVDVSHLTAEQKREVDTKLRTVSFMVLNRMNKNGLLIAFDAIEENWAILHRWMISSPHLVFQNSVYLLTSLAGI